LTDISSPEPELTSRIPLGRNALETLLVRGAMLPVNFGVTIITSRFLLPTGRGALVLGLLTVAIAGTLLGAVGIAITYELGRSSEDRRPVVVQAIVLSLALGLAATAILLPLNLVLVEERYRVVALLALSLPGILISQVLGGVLLAIGRIRFWNALQILAPAVTLVAMFAFIVGFHWGLAGAVAASILAQLCDSVLVLYRTREMWWPLRVFSAVNARMWSMLKLGLKLGVINSVSLLNYRIELFMLEWYRGLNGVGIYSMAVSLAELLWMISTSITAVTIMPAIGDDANLAKTVIVRGVRLAFVSSLIAAVGLGAVGWFAIPAIFGIPFKPAVWPLILLLPGVVAYAPASVISVYFSMRHGRTRDPLLTSVISGLITAALCLALIPPYGAKGAAVASTIGYFGGIGFYLRAFGRDARLPRFDFVPRPSDLAAVLASAKLSFRR
jgi:O-antigen/teichoic acid export membrane protein